MGNDYEAYERAVENVMERVKSAPDFSPDDKNIMLSALSKQIRKKLIRFTDGAIVRYQCPTCRHLYWMKSMLSCEHCGQMFVYGKEGGAE